MANYSIVSNTYLAVKTTENLIARNFVSPNKIITMCLNEFSPLRVPCTSPKESEGVTLIEQDFSSGESDQKFV